MFGRAKYFVLTMLVVALFAITRNDLANMRALTTDTSFFTTQLAEVTRLEKEMLKFRVDAAAYVHGYGGVSRDEMQLSFDLFWSRVNTQWTKFVNPEIDALRNYQHKLAALSQTLVDIELDVVDLKAGDHAALDHIEHALQAHAPIMTQMNFDAYAELIGRSVDIAVVQRNVTQSLDRFQWMFLIVGFTGVCFLLWQLRKGERLYRELQIRETEIRELATLDPLTGLNNRRHFDERMRSIDNGHWPDGCHLVLIDLDGFKAVNDVHGHEAGDHLLREVAHRLRGSAGHEVVLARLGGDEFGVILSGPLQRACDVAAAVIGAMQKPVFFSNRALKIGASIGIATRRSGGKPSEAMFREADKALYKSKSSGRNRFSVFGCETLSAAPEVTIQKIEPVVAEIELAAGGNRRNTKHAA